MLPMPLSAACYLSRTLDPLMQLFIWYLIWMSAWSLKSQHVQNIFSNLFLFLCFYLNHHTHIQSITKCLLCYLFNIVWFQPLFSTFLHCGSPGLLDEPLNWLYCIVLVLILSNLFSIWKGKWAYWKTNLVYSLHGQNLLGAPYWDTIQFFNMTSQLKVWPFESASLSTFHMYYLAADWMFLLPCMHFSWSTVFF